MHKWGKLQVVDINEEIVLCRICGTNIVDIANYIFDNETIAEPYYWEERCTCKGCANNFILRYNVFDKEGHIYSSVFSEDINNPEYNWLDKLSDSQKEVITEHITACEVCRERLSQELLADAWLKELIESLRQKSE